MSHYICIHGHFYQPPRENPWLEEIEVQDGAQPFHDWNERINAECYAPNGAARIVDGQGKIRSIVNNYEHISFNFGPTLLSWMETHALDSYRAILAADAVSARRRGGHGNALAQVYNHAIMPLLGERDQLTQVRWGLKDFEYRFGRIPTGMWLAETAVDIRSLRALYNEGIVFTILSPYQARRIRPLEDDEWTDASGGALDPTRAYRVDLGDGHSMAVFFYDGPISQSIAFDGLLSDGRRFAERLLSGFSPGRSHAQLVSVATDGETYGHHFRHGDMALAYTITLLDELYEKSGAPILTNYAEYLARHPAEYEVELHEPSAWSCGHGVDRWLRDCACNGGQQGWKAPLREALDWLKSGLDTVFERASKDLLMDPWAARDAYIQVLLRRSTEATDEFLAAHRKRKLDKDERVAVLRLLEMQRHGLLMFTSCGWFFDEIRRIETVQVLQYAARAMQLARLFGSDFEPDLVDRLRAAPGDGDTCRNGADIYRKKALPARVDLPRVVAHYAMQGIVDGFSRDAHLGGYVLSCRDTSSRTFGRTALATGYVDVTSHTTQEAMDAAFAVLHFGGPDFFVAVSQQVDRDEYDRWQDELSQVFERHSMGDLVLTLQQLSSNQTYTVHDLFTDSRRQLLSAAMREANARCDSAYRQVYEESVPLMEFLLAAGAPPPVEFTVAAEYVLRRDLERRLEEGGLTLAEARTAVEGARRWGISLHTARLERLLRHQVEAAADDILGGLEVDDAVERLEQLLDVADVVDVSLDLWRSQNLIDAAMRAHADHPALFKLAQRLGFAALPAVEAETRQKAAV